MAVSDQFDAVRRLRENKWLNWDRQVGKIEKRPQIPLGKASNSQSVFASLTILELLDVNLNQWYGI